MFRKVIPCLDTKDGKLVKGVHFVGLKDLGDPAEAAAAYCAAGADELVLLDITATVEGRATLLAVVKRAVARITCPLTIGGGVRSVEDAKALFDLGVSRVSVNSAAVKRPGLLRELAEAFGSDRVTLAIDTRHNTAVASGFEVMVSGGNTATGLDAVAWARKAQTLGVGAVLPTSMEGDGSQAGYDLPMTRAIADAVTVPVIASGGAGKLEDLSAAILEGHADSVLVASIAHFGTFTIRQMKDHLRGRGIPVKE
ncbi:MAG: imidazole glycerol phosphate synthase cyclase subunit [Kiritimatiellaeota bacterium]|nr:imidazole glycerol phosphate synthase cyclase subunit [Kiritimatiellota bacterium]